MYVQTVLYYVYVGTPFQMLQRVVVVKRWLNDPVVRSVLGEVGVVVVVVVMVAARTKMEAGERSI